ncbi:MAG: hypothetical protein M3301_00850 [Chloroflexota bacterium]|nr:hypothetical protein [Chloroflexota bacterium]
MVRSASGFVVVILVAVLGLAGCAPRPSSSLPASTAPTASPSASPPLASASGEVAQAFVAQISSPSFSARSVLSGTAHFGNVTAPVSGDYSVAGRDYQSKVVIAIPGSILEAEEMGVHLKRYAKFGTGPWVLQGTAPLTGSPYDGTIAEVLAKIGSVKDVGVEERDGKQLHRLRPASGTRLGARALGLVDPSITGVSGTVEFLAEPDGKPAVMTLHLTWTQEEEGVRLPVKMDVEFKFSNVGGRVLITPPPEVWTVFRSTRFGYEMAHPEDWEVKVDKKDRDVYISPEGLSVVVFHTRIEKGLRLNELSARAVDYNRKTYGRKPEKIESIILGGRKARLLDYHVTIKGVLNHFLDVLAVNGTSVYEIGLITKPGTERVDRDFLAKFLSTFRCLDARGAPPA